MRFSISKNVLPAVAIAAVLLAASGRLGATTYQQAGFSETTVFSGLTNPTVVRFLPDGRVLVAEKSGLIKMFPNLTTNSFTIVADLRTEVHNFWDRGLLGLAVDPNFATNNFIYVLYSYDAPIGGTPPAWGVAGQTSDGCPTPPGATNDGCVISGRLSRLTATGATWTASETPLINDWCQQFPSHSIGSVDFGADGYLYLSGGDGASFNNADWGQFGGGSGSPTPPNPCGDPPFPLGTPQTKPTAEGGALRSQSPRRTAGQPRVLNGSVLRLDPATGAAAPGNPMIGSGDVNEQRIIGYGLRNPFRMIVRPGTNEVWIADVGWNTWEELNKIPDLTTARNFGWPCYEGNFAQYTGLNICPAQAQTVLPVLTYNHSASVVAGDGCAVGSSSVAGMAFYQNGSNYPPNFTNAFFFSDYSRKCMWVMFPDGSGNPNPASTAAFAANAKGPVNLQIGPDGNLYYVDFDGGTIVRVKYGLDAVATATPTSGSAPLTVNFNGSGSVPAQVGDTLTYAWDLDGDGEYDDSTAQNPTFVYTVPGTYTARLKVTDQRGASDISSPMSISVGNDPPLAVIDTPDSTLTWKVNDVITFSGHATDPQEGALPVSALSWKVIIHHCPSNCHTHIYQTFDGVAGGSFPAPDHEYPSYLEIQLTATDSQLLTNTASVNLQPQTASLNFQTSPVGLQLTVGTSAPQTTPFTQTVIVGSLTSVEATSPQGAFPNIWDFSSWSDGGAQSHGVTAPAGVSSYTATYATHADLSLGVLASPEPVGAGATLTYTLNVANSGPSQAGSVVVTDTLPAGTAFVSASGAGWVCNAAGPIVTCTMPALAITAAAPISIAVTAPPNAGTIVNNASVASATSDPVAANNSVATTSNVFARADLSITQSGAPAAICTGQTISYTLTVANGGPSTATSVSAVDALPAGASLVSASGLGWTCGGSSTVTCTRPSLPPGAAPLITIVISAPGSAGTAANAVSISSATNDPSAANNAASASTTVNAIPAPPTASNGGAICAGATLQLTASTVASATYSWTGPNGFVSALQNPTIPGATVAASGTYSVTVTVNACSSTAATTVASVRPLPTALVSGTAQICAGGAAPVSAALTGTGPWNVTWSDGVTQTGVAASPATRSVSPSATTTYSVTAVSDANCTGTASGAAVVTVNPRPNAVASGAATICAGGATPLSGSGGTSCSWAPATGLSSASSCSPSASPLSTTTYTLTVTDANGCVSNNAPTLTVTVNPKPTAAVSGSAAICAGGATTIAAALTGTGPWNVTWSDGVTQSGVAASPATRSVGPSATTTYTVTAVSDSHCAGTSTGSALVTVNPRPTAVASGSALICEGGATPLNGSGATSCSWAPAAGLSDPSSCAPVASPAATTTYTLTVSDATGCASTNAPTVTVTVTAKPTATVSGGAAICAGTSAAVQAALTGTGPWTVTWSDGVVQTAAASPAARQVSPVTTTTYTVTAISDTHCAGTSSGAAVVTVSPTPAAVASGTAAVCAGGSTPLSGSGGTSCSWAPATGLSNPLSCSPTASPSATTVYTLTVTEGSCASTNAPSVTVTVNPIPMAPTAGNSGPICPAGTLQLTASNVPGATYHWTGPNGFSSPLQNPTIPGVTAAAAGVYGVTATVDGCTSAAGTTSVTVLTVPTATVSGSAAICAGGSTDLSVVLTGTGPWNLTWSDGPSQSVGSSPATRTVAPADTTTYTVTAVSDALCAGIGSGSAVVTVGTALGAPVVVAANSAIVGATNLAASVADHSGSTYAWTLTGGAITSGQGAAAITFDAGAPGTTMSLSVVESNATCTSPAATVKVQVDFLDVPPAHPFHDFVDTVARNGVTAGCGSGDYCPDAPNTRAQMAVFLLKSKLGSDHVPPPATGSVFLDVPASDPFAPWIEELFALGVTGGCGGGKYCPGAPVTRAQMAVFLLKTLNGSSYVPPAATGAIFGDVPQGGFAAAWIEDLYNRSITGGCQADPLLYCPDRPNTRGQMAVFLTKTFSLQ